MIGPTKLCVTLLLTAQIPALALAIQENTLTSTSAITQLVDDVKVASDDPGVLRNLLRKVGQSVSQGEPLATLDDTLYEAEYRAAVKDRQVAEVEASNNVNLLFAQKSNELNEKILKRSQLANHSYPKTISRTEIDQLELQQEQSELSERQAGLEQEVARLNLQLKRERENVAKVRLQNRKISAPLSGLVVETYVQPGEWVGAGQPIARIVNLDCIRIRAAFPQEQIFAAQQLSRKANFVFQRDGEDVQLPAEVVFVSPEVAGRQRDFEIWAEVDNRDRKLLAGVDGKLIVELASGQDK